MLCKVLEKCFYKGCLYKVGDTLHFEGKDLPAHLSEIKPAKPEKIEKAEQK